MKDRLGNAAWWALGFAVVIGALWLLGRLLLTSAKLALFVSVVLFTVWVVAPDLMVLVGRREGTVRRPWLVRLREHRWAPVPTPFGRKIPRSAAYLAILFGWWLLC